jgi:serine/threonine protein kinase
MRGLDHPSIVRLLNFAESDEHYFLTLEYVPSLSPTSTSRLIPTRSTPG